LCRFEEEDRQKGCIGHVVSIQLFVSVRGLQVWEVCFGSTCFNTTICVGSRLCYIKAPDREPRFNTTICVGSSHFLISVSCSFLVFQYNYLCRFELSALCWVLQAFQFQYNYLCRFEVFGRDDLDIVFWFQYNYLCRFENVDINILTIQRSFNTTICVGSRNGTFA